MIVVFGSLNVDLVTPVERLPGAGETVMGPSYALHPGGKGANQALAARRAGAPVRLVGAVGTDAFADIALSLLAADGVDLADVARVAVPTPTAPTRSSSPPAPMRRRARRPWRRCRSARATSCCSSARCRRRNASWRHGA